MKKQGAPSHAVHAYSADNYRHYGSVNNAADALRRKTIQRRSDGNTGQTGNNTEEIEEKSKNGILLSNAWEGGREESVAAGCRCNSI